MEFSKLKGKSTQRKLSFSLEAAVWKSTWCIFAFCKNLGWIIEVILEESYRKGKRFINGIEQDWVALMSKPIALFLKKY